MSKKQKLPPVPNSANAYLNPSFNAGIDPLDVHLQELDPGLLRYTRTRNQNILAHSNYNSSLQNPLTEARSRLACTALNPTIVTPWSPEAQASRSNLTSPENFNNLRNQCFSLSPFSTSLQKPVPPFTLPKFTRVRLGEDDIVIDSSAINELSTNSFSTPEAFPKQKSVSSDSFVSGRTSSSSRNDLYKTEICSFWERRRTCRYGSKCKYAHGEDELRTAPIRDKTEICRVFAATGKCMYGVKCRHIHGFSLTDNCCEDFNLSTDLVEILSASRGDFEGMLSTISLNPFAPGNRTQRKRLPIFEVICPSSPVSLNYLSSVSKSYY